MNVTFDCTDSARMARFWGEVTRWPATKVDMPGNPFWVVASEDDALPHLVFVEVHESKQVKNRIHLDLLPQDGSQPRGAASGVDDEHRHACRRRRPEPAQLAPQLPTRLVGVLHRRMPHRV